MTRYEASHSLLSLLTLQDLIHIMDNIIPPPDSLYASYKEAYNTLKSYGMQYGYGFILKESKPYNSNIKT